MTPPYISPQDQHLATLGAQMRSSPGFSESLAIATWRLMPEDEQKSRLADKDYALQETQLCLQESYQFETQEIAFFQALNEYHQQNIDFVLLSEQWAPEERQTMFAQGLLPYVNNRMRRYALTAMGEQMGQQTELRVRAKDPKNDTFATAANRLLRYFEKRNDWKLNRHYAYRDGMVGSRAIGGVRKDPRDPMGSIIIGRYRPEEFIWHTRTAFSPRLKECKYFERIYYDERTNIMREFPEWYNEIRNFSAGMWGHMAQHADQLDVLIKPKVQPVLGSFNAPYVHNPSQYMYWKESILRRDLFRRHPVTKYLVVDPYRRVFYTDESFDKVAAWGRAAYQYWQNVFLLQGITNMEPQIPQPRVVEVDTVEKLTWAGNILLRVEPVGESFPYECFIPEFVDGQITSFMGHGKDPQRMVNRMHTAIDEAAGGVKPKTVVNRWGMPVDFTDEDIKANLRSITEPLIVNVPPGTALSDTLYVTSAPQIGPQLEVLYKIATDTEQQMFGGENYIGQAESGVESGKAVLARQTAASLATIPYEEEFWLWEENLAKRALQNIQEMDPATIQAIVSQEDPGQADAITEAFFASGVQSLREIDMVAELVETAASPSQRDRIVATASTIIGQAPQQAKYWTDIIIRNMDIDEDIRQSVLEMQKADDDFEKKLAMDQQLHQQQMEKEELDVKYLDRMIKLKELEIAANPPVKRSLMGQIDMTNPAMAATYLNAAQMEADPLAVARDIAAGAVMRQGALDMQQVHRNKLLLPQEKEGLRNKAKQPYKNVPQAKDTAARKSKASAA